MNHCDTCRWWHPPALTPLGLCNRSTMPDGKLSTFARMGAVWTAPDFGCVQWETESAGGEP